MYKELSKLN